MPSAFVALRVEYRDAVVFLVVRFRFVRAWGFLVCFPSERFSSPAVFLLLVADLVLLLAFDFSATAADLRVDLSFFLFNFLRPCGNERCLAREGKIVERYAQC
jgi:hypothetical protein